MTKILMAVDGSEHDDKTIAFLGKLLQGANDAEVTVVNVANLAIPTPPVMEMGMGAMLPNAEEMARWERELREQAQAIVAKADATAKRAGLKTRTLVVWGSPADVLVHLAQEGGYDMIALGSRGAGQVAGIFLGSVSDRVAHRSKVPVLIVR